MNGAFFYSKHIATHLIGFQVVSIAPIKVTQYYRGLLDSEKLMLKQGRVGKITGILNCGKSRYLLIIEWGTETGSTAIALFSPDHFTQKLRLIIINSHP